MSQALSDTKTVDRVQENLIGYYRLFAGLPGVTFVEGDISRVTSKGLPGSTVLRTMLPDHGVDDHLNDTLAQIGREVDAFDWWVFPTCRPNDLGERMISMNEAGGPDGAWRLHGKIGGPGGTWFLADLADLIPPTVSADFHVKRVDDLTLLAAWRDISAEGFGGGDYQILYDAFARHGLGPDTDALHYIGYMNDTPVTSATLFLAGGIASVFNVSTPERFRRQGFGGAITYAAFQDAIPRGYDTAYVWSSPMGRGAYAGLGFVTTDFGIREYEWQKIGKG